MNRDENINKKPLKIIALRKLPKTVVLLQPSLHLSGNKRTVGNANKLPLSTSVKTDSSAYGFLWRTLEVCNRASFSFALLSAKLTKKNAYQYN